MSVLESAAKVLEQAGGPLRFEEITRRILAAGLWVTKGRTPAATVHARLAVDIQGRGSASPFQRTDKGTFALRAWGLPEFVGRSADRTVQPRPGRPKPPERLSFTDAAERVLERYGSRKPMHYRDIARKALELGLVVTTGQTPQSTLYTSVIQEVRRSNRRGEQPRFALHGNGQIGLSKWMATGLALQIEQHNKNVQKKLHQRLGQMPPAGFEALIAKLLVQIGFEDVLVTGRSGDGGIDVRGTMVTADVIRTRMAVQVKRWKSNVQAPTVQQVRGSLGTHEQGLIIATSDYSKGAREEAERADATPVALMNGEQLVKLLVENDLGVHRHAHQLIELDTGGEDERNGADEE